jgi:hypothetical protein
MQSWQSAPVIGSAPAPRQQPMGDPIVAPAPPSERRAERDQQLQEVTTAQALQNDAERLRLAREADARASREAERGGVEQGKAASFLKRAINAETNFRGLGDVQPRSIPGEVIKGAFPNVSNTMSDPKRQRADQAEREFIAAILRYDSGAAIPPEEFVTNGQIYFPRPGDAPETLAQKAEARRVAIEGLLAAAGPGGERVQLPDFLLNEGRPEYEGPEGAISFRVTDDRPADDTGPATGGGGNGGLTVGQIGSGLAQGVGDIVQGVGDTVGMVTDPFARVLADALGYDGSQMQSLGTVTRESAGLPQNQNETASRINQFASSALVGGLAARGGATLANAGGTAQNVLAAVGRTPIRDTVAGAGAGLGSAVGEDIGGPIGGAVGALAGGLGGYAAANRAMTAAAPRQANALSQAADRQNVNLLPADTGGPIARAVTTGTRASPLSVAPVTNAAETQQRQFGQAVQRTAAREGEVVDTQAAGETIKKGAQDFVQRSRQLGERLYDRAFKQAQGVTAIKPTATVAAAREALDRMRNNPAASSSDISGLESFIANIEGGVSIQGLRDARTQLSQGVYNGALRSSSEQAMWKGILGNVADDIDAGLRSVGREDAANTFRAADKLWRERIEVIDQTLAPIIGKDGLKSGEQVLSAIEGMTRGTGGGNMRLSRLLSTLSPEEAGNVRATLIDRLGKATPGAQDAQGEAFSAARFLTNWNRMTPQARASMFPDKGTRDALGDLAVIAEGTKRGQSLANTSNTGVALTSANVIAGGAGAAANLPATLLVGGSVYLTGKLMASPRFAKMLARTAKMPPEAANRTFKEQLGILASRDPALGGDINRLLEAVNDNGARLAAEEDRQQ